MMKIRNIILSLLCSLVFICADAKPIDRNSAMQKAKAFMQEKGWTVSEEYVSSSTIAKRSAKGNANEELFYIFNATDNRGFVIVSGDDSTEEILGYCDNTAFDWENIPSSLMGWLVGTQEQIARVRERNMVSSSVSYLHAPIAPLLKSKWGQDAPYNQFCPVLDGKRTPTGCLATAVAQVMYYHRWPQAATKSIPSYATNTYKQQMPELASTTFKWSSMSDSYRSTSKNDAVAELMLYTGQALQMDYAPGGSGAYDYYLPEILAMYFDYPATAKYVEREGISIAEWDDLIYNELANKRPVVYCGYTPNWEGHAFVCDGYDGNGLYHINWGWDGYYNGYFRLSVLNPGTTSTTGSASTEDGYTEGQNVVIGIQTDDENLKISQPWPLTVFKASGTKMTVEFRSYDAGNYYVTLLHRDDDGNYEEVLGKKTVQVKYSRRSNVEIDLSALEEGHYTLYPAVRPVNGDEWRILGSGYYYAEVDRGLSFIEVELHPMPKIEVEKVEFLKNNQGTTAKLNVSIVNTGEMFNGNLYFFTGPKEGPLNKVSEVSVGLLGGEDMTLPLTLRLPSSSDIRFCISQSADGFDRLFDKTYYGHDLSLESYTVSWDPILINAIVQNNSVMTYKNDIIADCYLENTNKSIGTMKKSVDIEPGKTTQLEYKMSIDKSKKYYLVLQYLPHDFSNMKTEMAERIMLDYVFDGVEQVMSSDADNRRYNLLGQPVGSDFKGIVISNGKRYIK